jgi:hypothetical protein
MVGELSMSKIKVNPDSFKPKKEWKRHKVEEGNNIYRFLPPFGDSANGYPYRRWMVIWGLLDPDSGRVRPYASPITGNEKACPVMEYVKGLSEKAETLKSNLKAQGATDDQIKERLKSLQKVIGNLRPKGVYAWNAVDKAGKVGLLEIKSTAHKKLKALMNEYLNDYRQDPTSINSDDDDSGVWFNIKRIGKGFDTEYDAEKVQEKRKVDGRLTFVDDRSPLPESVIENWEEEAYDLSSIYQTKSYDEIKAILDANLSRIIQECPDAALDGYEVQESADVDEAPSTTSKGTSPVSTRFDDEDDDDDEEILSQKSPTKSSAPASSTSSNDEDIFAMADDILNS